MAMTKSAASPQQLDMLKADLGFFDSTLPAAMENYLQQLLLTAERDLLQMGIAVDRSKIPDCQLSEMYAAWLYRSRATGAGKPRMLLEAIHNAQTHNATTEAVP